MLPRFLLRMIGKVVRRRVLRHLAAFEAATHHCQAVQEELLQRIVRTQAATSFGRDFGFAQIQTVADFRRQLPVAGYEFLEPYITRVRRGEIGALLADGPVHMFALTSGTTASRKYIPVTPQYLADYQRGWNIWGMKVFLDHPEVKLRPIVQMSSDWDEFRSEADVPCGSVTGLTAHTQKRLIRWLYCVPGCTARIKDGLAKYYVALRLSVPRPVRLMIAANPSTIVNLARVGDQEKETLIRDIHDGTLSSRYEVPAGIREELSRQLRPQPERARQLEEIVRRTGTLYPRDYWPREFLCGNWTGGSVGAYLRQFPKYYGTVAVRDVGLIASEGRMTIPMSDGTPSGVLDITSHYFEFIPEEEGDREQPTVLGAHEVQEGKNYFILLTTAYGLYRYHIHDLVRVTGFHQGTPLVEFLSKGSHFANVTGEKVSEYHVTQAMGHVLRQLDQTLTAYTLAPCWNEDLPYYGLFVERSDFTTLEEALELARRLEEQLQQMNIEYASKRSSQRLGPVRLELLPKGTWPHWDRERLARTGGTPEQYKHPCLIGDPQFRLSMPVEEEVTPPLSSPSHRVAQTLAS